MIYKDMYIYLANLNFNLIWILNYIIYYYLKYIKSKIPSWIKLSKIEEYIFESQEKVEIPLYYHKKRRKVNFKCIYFIEFGDSNIYSSIFDNLIEDGIFDFIYFK